MKSSQSNLNGGSKAGSKAGSKVNLRKSSSLAASKTSLASRSKASLNNLQEIPAPIAQPSVSVDKFPATEEEPTISNAYYHERTLEGIFPLFLSSQSQAIAKCVIDEDVTADKMFRMVPKSDLMQDMATRLAISDFTPAKALIIDYPGESIMVHYDPEYKYTQNFFLVVSPETVESIINPKKDIPGEEGAVEAAAAGSGPRSAKWQSFGSEKEVEAEWIIQKSLIVMEVAKKNADFRKPLNFGDRDAVDGFLETKPYKDPNFDLLRMEKNIGIQSVPKLESVHIQTSWFRPINFACQYEPLIMDEAEQEEIQQSEALENFMLNISPRLEQYLQQNEIMDIFHNDFLHLGEEELSLEQGAQTILQEYQSFTDLVNSKDKCVSAIDWHPNQRGVLAVSCSIAQGFDERIGRTSLSKKHVIIIWSFHDPIHPQLILEAPETVACFQFSPTEASLLVGGCENGQLVMWDITEYQEILQSNRKHSAEDENSEETKDKQAKIPTVKYLLASSIEFSHRGPITDLQWLPKHFEIGNNGEPIEGAENGDKQLVTCSLDGTAAIWDLRFKKDLKSLDLAWRPLLRVALSSLDNSYDYSLTKINLRTAINESASVTTPANAKVADAPEGESKPPPKAVGKSFISKFYCATEEGDLIYADWIAEKSSEDKVTRVEFSSGNHFGPMCDLSRNPFFPDILLSVGGWSFHIWKEKSQAGPLISNQISTSYVTCGRWSPTRAGVFYIGRADGMLEIWDLMDRSHSARTIQSVATSAVSSISIKQYPNKGGQQYIAIGDDSGTLHILEVPRNLQRMTKNEKVNVAALFERENKRLIAYAEMKKQKAAERASYEAAILEQNKLAASKAAEENKADLPPDSEAPKEGNSAEEEKEEKLYLAMENAFLEAQGMIAPAAD